MKLSGRLVRDTKIIREAYVERGREGISFRDALEECLLSLCKELDIQVPLWLRKNTTEFSAFHKTFFTRDQFLENVKFDRFEIKLE